MAKRRAISLAIIDNDVFLDMPLSSQMLYVHLHTRADDYGFISPKKIMRMIGASTDDLQILIAKRYIIIFQSGVVVIKHWPLHDTIKSDRLTPTTYQEELKQLTNNEFGAYTEIKNMSKIATEIAELDAPKFRPQKKGVVRKRKGGVEKLPTSQGVKSKKNENVSGLSPQVKLSKVKLSYINTIGDKSPADQIGILYYQVIKSLKLPVKNHNNVRTKIKALQTEDSFEAIINYLTFMRDHFEKLVFDFKPDVNEALDIYSKRKAIENAISRASNEVTVWRPRS